MGKGITEAGHRLNFLVQHHIVTKEVKTMAMPVQHSRCNKSNFRERISRNGRSYATPDE
jgi:hypothetical protein